LQLNTIDRVRINMTIVLDELVSILTDFKTFFMRSAFAFYLLRNVLLSLNDASGPGGDSVKRALKSGAVSTCRKRHVGDVPYESDGVWAMFRM